MTKDTINGILITIVFVIIFHFGCIYAQELDCVYDITELESGYSATQLKNDLLQAGVEDLKTFETDTKRGRDDISVFVGSYGTEGYVIEFYIDLNRKRIGLDFYTNYLTRESGTWYNPFSDYRISPVKLYSLEKSFEKNVLDKTKILYSDDSEQTFVNKLFSRYIVFIFYYKYALLSLVLVIALGVFLLVRYKSKARQNPDSNILPSINM